MAGSHPVARDIPPQWHLTRGTKKLVTTSYNRIGIFQQAVYFAKWKNWEVAGLQSIWSSSSIYLQPPVSPLPICWNLECWILAVSSVMDPSKVKGLV
jgi:hypothetical protein